MGKGANDFTYTVGRRSQIEFDVAKYDLISGGAQPVAVYNVIWDPTRNPPIGRGKCNCHAATYRNTGVNDRHVQIVQWWIAQGETIQEFRWPPPNQE